MATGGRTSPLRYAVGMFGTSVPVNMFKTYAAAYYVMQKGVTTAQFAQLLFIYTFLDAVDNPVYGFLSDRTRTRWGRRRPWFVIGAPLLALCFIAFYNIPSFVTGDSIYPYMLLMYILTGTIDSLINANYGALFPELFKGDALRAKTNAMRQAFQVVAMVLSIALTPIITSKIGYGMTSVIYGAIATVVMIFCALGCHEEEIEETGDRPNLFKTLKEILTNPKFWLFGFANAFYSAAMALVMAAVPFYVEYRLRLGSTANTVLLGAVLILAVGSVALWSKFVVRFTLMPVWRAALMVLGSSFASRYFTSSLPAAVAASCVVGFGFAGSITTMDLIGARIMDEDTRRYGLKREGIYCSIMGFMNRLSGFFTSLAFLLVGRLYGFISGDIPGPQPGNASRFLMTIFPFIMMLLSIGFSRFLKFPELDSPGSADAGEISGVKEEAN